MVTWSSFDDNSLELGTVSHSWRMIYSKPIAILSELKDLGIKNPLKIHFL